MAARELAKRRRRRIEASDWKSGGNSEILFYRSATASVKRYGIRIGLRAFA